VHEGSLESVPKLVHPGLLVAGSAAGLLVNNLFTFRGIDLAIESGALAAEAYLEAKDAGDFSETGLASYHAKLEASFVMQDMRTFRNANKLVENPRFVKEYPQLVNELLEAAFASAAG
jgi:electron transfer flavoprotein-quinone oxidoreductase